MGLLARARERRFRADNVGILKALMLLNQEQHPVLGTVRISMPDETYLEIVAMGYYSEQNADDRRFNERRRIERRLPT